MDDSSAVTLRSRIVRAAVRFLEIVHGDLVDVPDVAIAVNSLEPRWADGLMDSHYAPRYERDAVLNVGFEQFARWRDLPEYEKFAQTFREDAWLAAQEDTLIAVAGGSRVELLSTVVIRGLHPLMTDSGSVADFDRPRVEAAVLEVVDDYLARTAVVVSVVPLLGYQATVDIVLDAETSVRRLDRDEFSRAVNLSIIGQRTTSVSPGTVRVPIDHQWALIERQARPKVVGGEPTFGRDLYQLSVRAQQFIDACRLTVKGGVIAGVAASWVVQTSVVAGSARIDPLTTGVLEGFDGARVHAQDVDRLTAMDKLLSDLRRQDRHQYDLALRRFRESATRTNLDDTLVDLVVMLESVVLNPADRSELAFRLSLNTSLLARAPGSSSGAIRRFLVKVYDTRSQIIHGTIPKSYPTLTGPKSHSLETTVDDLDRICRSVLSGCIEELVHTGQPHDWSLILDRLLDSSSLAQREPRR